MSKYAVYHIISPLGYKVDVWTDGGKKDPTFKELFENEVTRVMKLEQAGCKIETTNTLPAPVAPQATTPSQDRFCTTCGNKLTYKEGTSKAGKPYKGYFCSERGHEPQWVK